MNIKTNNWDSSEPWFENENFAHFLIDKIILISILDKCGLEYVRCNSGNFTHKMKCPLPIHLDGQERTASFYCNDTNFHCFGCGSGGSIIDFIRLYRGMPYYKAIETLAKMYKLVDISEEELKNIEIIKKVPIEHTITPYIYHTGIIIREHLKNINNGGRGKWERWAMKEFKRLDYYAENYSDDEWERVKDNQERIIKLIQAGKM